MTDSFSTTLGKGVEQIVAQLEAENSALRAVANNLATANELAGLGGKASLAQQLKAHNLPLSTEEDAAMAWLDAQCVKDFSLAIRRLNHCWILRYEGNQNFFRGQPNATLRELILEVYRAECEHGTPILGADYL